MPKLTLVVDHVFQNYNVLGLNFLQYVFDVVGCVSINVACTISRGC